MSMLPGDASMVTLLLGSDMNRMAAINFRQATRSCSILFCVVWCRSYFDLWNLLVYIVFNQ